MLADKLRGREQPEVPAPPMRADAVSVFLVNNLVSVDDVPVTGVMPGVPHVPDEEITAIVDYLITEGGTVKNTSAFNLDVLKAARAAGRVPQAATNARRNELFDAGLIK